MKENSRYISPEEGISGRLVDFRKGEKVSWGIEIDLPLNLPVKERLEKKYGIKIPDQINRLKFLDLNPQESLPVYLRNLSNDKDAEWLETNLDKLVATNTLNKNARRERRKTIEQLFFMIFGRNEEEVEEFNSLLSKSPGKTILVVEGHSWEAPWSIGEQDPHEPKEESDKKVQRRGNDVSVREILKRYNDPDTYSAILLVACYKGTRGVCALDVPLAYAIGKTGTDQLLSGLLPTIVVHSRKKEGSLKKYRKGEYNSDMAAGDVSAQEIHEQDVPDSFTLEVDKPVLVGCPEGSVEGFETYAIDALSGNKFISEYAVQLKLNNDRRIIISRPRLNLGGKEYVGQNLIVVMGSDHKTVEVENEYDAGIGGKNLENLYIGDDKAENCFSLSIEENNRVVVNEVFTNGEKL